MQNWLDLNKMRLSLLIAIVLVMAQLFTGLGLGVLTSNTVNAANQDAWWIETTDGEGNAPIVRDKLEKNINWNLVNMMGYDYLAIAGITGHNILRFVGELPVPVTGEYEFYMETNNHPNNNSNNKEDTVRLWVDRTLLIDTVGDPVIGEAPVGKISLEADEKYDIRIELVVKSGVPQSNLKLSWIPPDTTTKTHVIDLITADPDIDPPSKVDDLRAGTISSHSVELLWTAPGSDDILLEGPEDTELLWGTVSSYDIRYSTEPVDGDVEQWWGDATPLHHGVIPAHSGIEQVLTIEDLAQETTYYFALRSEDESNNESLISNIVSVTTLAPDVTPPAAVQDLEVAYDDTDKVIRAIWTAPGDDGNIGTATSYDLRYDMKPIESEEDWQQAIVVTGAPIPEEAGTLQSVEMVLDWEKTYYFVLRATDKEGNESGFSNVFEYTTPALPIGVFGKIPVDPSMVYNEWYPHVDKGQNGGSKAMFDEQDIAGDPLNGQGGLPTTSMHFGSSSYNRDYSSVVVDLGENYKLDYIFPYYGGGANTGQIKIYAGEHFNWTLIHEDANIKGNFWDEIDLQDKDIETRYLRFIIDPVDSRRAINEVVLYGKRLGTGMDVVPEPAEHTKPWMDEFIGINGFRDDPLDVMLVAGNIREYHNWSLEVGSLPNGEIDTEFPHQYPNNLNFFNPSSCCGGDMDYDAYFQMLHEAGITVFPAIQGTVGYLGETFGDKMVYPIGADPNIPESYRAHADHMYQFTARYGSQVVPDENLKLADGQPRVSGLGYIEYFENGNETNAYWEASHANFTPYEFAAMMSADYDGHEGTIVNANGESTYGVKNADPNAKMVMAGLAGYSMEYILGIHRWAQVNRTDGKFPADVLNVHFYANASGDDQGVSTIGISPEDFDAKGKMRAIADYRDRYLPEMEFWVSEFGYDTHPNSPQRSPAFGSFSAEEVQGQWLVRTYLALAAAGVDKAQMFMIRDVNNGGGKFNTSGLVTAKGEWDKKKSWYYVFTLKNRLMNLRFQDEPESGHPDVMIQSYENEAGETKAYVVWAPTSDEVVVHNYKLQLPASTTQADLVLMVDGSTVGEQSPLTIDGDHTVTIDVSERPLFVMLDGSGELQTPQWSEDSWLQATDMTETELLLSWHDISDTGVSMYQVLQDGEVIGSVPSHSTSLLVTDLQPGTEYEFSVQASLVPGIWSDDGPSIVVLSADMTKPTQPTQLDSNLVSDSKVSIFWQPSSDNVAVTGYRIYANGQLVLTVGGETFYAGVTGLLPRTEYEIVVTAIDAAGNESEASEAIIVTTESRPSFGGVSPSPVDTGDMPSGPVTTSVDLDVNPIRSAEGETGYYITRSDIERALHLAGDTERMALSLNTSLSMLHEQMAITIQGAALQAVHQSPSQVSIVLNFGSVRYELLPDRWDNTSLTDQDELTLIYNMNVPQEDEALVEDALDQQGMVMHGGFHQLQLNGKMINDEAMLGFMIIDTLLDTTRVSVVKWNAERQQFVFVPAVFQVDDSKTYVQFKPRGEGQYMIVDRFRQFTDIDHSWAKKDIELLTSKMILNGRNATTFAPHDTIKRAEFAALMVQASGLGDMNWDATDLDFNDVSPDEWFYQAVGIMRYTGLMIGHEQQFRPHGHITREEAIVVIHRLMNDLGFQINVSSDDLNALNVYTDFERISDWSHEAIAALIKTGVISPSFSNQSFTPHEYITREECAYLLRKALQLMAYI